VALAGPSFPPVVRYVLAANQGDSGSLTLKMKAICPSETSVLTRTTRRLHIAEDSILHCYRRENIESYIVVLFGRLIITFDEATDCQLYLHGNT
jgi:hypothetical protein